jgi:hypothetical protein
MDPGVEIGCQGQYLRFDVLEAREVLKVASHAEVATQAAQDDDPHILAVAQALGVLQER